MQISVIQAGDADTNISCGIPITKLGGHFSEHPLEMDPKIFESISALESFKVLREKLNSFGVLIADEYLALGNQITMNETDGSYLNSGSRVAYALKRVESGLGLTIVSINEVIDCSEGIVPDDVSELRRAFVNYIMEVRSLLKLQPQF